MRSPRPISPCTSIRPNPPRASISTTSSSFCGRASGRTGCARSFRLIPGVKSASGIVRVYLQQVHPSICASTSARCKSIREDPALPISTPAAYSRQLAEALGPFYTQGIPEETSAYRAGLLSATGVPGAEPQGAGRQPAHVPLRAGSISGRPAVLLLLQRGSELAHAVGQIRGRPAGHLSRAWTRRSARRWRRPARTPA